MDSYSIGRVFSRTWAQLKSNFWTLLGFLVVSSILAWIVQQMISIPMKLMMTSGLTQAAILANPGHPEAIIQALFLNPAFWITFILSMIISLATQAVVQAGCLHAILGTNGVNKARFGDCFSVGFKKCIPFFLATLIIFIATLFGFFLLIIPGIILSLMWSVALPALVAENLCAKDSLARSQQLTSGLKGQIFLTHLVFTLAFFALLALFAAFIFVLFGSALTPLMGHVSSDQMAFGIIGLIIRFFLLLIFLLPLFLIIQMYAISFGISIYRETRLVKEGHEDYSLVHVFE